MLPELVLLIALTQPKPPTVALVQYDEIQVVWLAGVRAEYARLKHLRHLTPEQQARKAAQEIALGTLPDEPKCITWKQHEAETASWHEAPEREYVSCNDPRVGPQGGR